MFNTWKQGKNCYVVLPTGPPFERPDNGKPRRSACNPCRIRKIRCTSELSGCRNCQKRGLDCQYGIDGGTGFNIGAVKGRRELRQKSASGVPVSSTTNVGGDAGSPQPSYSSDRLSDDLDRLQVEVCPMEADWSEFMFGSRSDISPGDKSASPNTCFITPPHNPSLNTASGMFELINTPESILRGETFLLQTPLEGSMNISGSDPCSSHLDSFLTASDTIAHGGGGPPEVDKGQGVVPAVDSSSPLSCQCSTTPLETWEMLIINISSKEATADSFVRCQKAAMSSCEALASCHACSSRSQDVMLLIDICTKLLESLKAQDAELSTRHQNDECRSSALHRSPTRFAMSNHEDYNDGNDVLRSFWVSRMQRLGRLIARVGDLLHGEQWLAHRGLLQSVQLQFTGVMFGW